MEGQQRQLNLNRCENMVSQNREGLRFNHPSDPRVNSRQNPAVLTQWIKEHTGQALPILEERMVLASRANMSLEQVDNWFSNEMQFFKDTVLSLQNGDHHACSFDAFPAPENGGATSHPHRLFGCVNQDLRNGVGTFSPTTYTYHNSESGASLHPHRPPGHVQDSGNRISRCPPVSSYGYQNARNGNVDARNGNMDARNGNVDARKGNGQVFRPFIDRNRSNPYPYRPILPSNGQVAGSGNRSFPPPLLSHAKRDFRNVDRPYHPRLNRAYQDTGIGASTCPPPPHVGYNYQDADNGITTCHPLLRSIYQEARNGDRSVPPLIGSANKEFRNTGQPFSPRLNCAYQDTGNGDINCSPFIDCNYQDAENNIITHPSLLRSTCQDVSYDANPFSPPLLDCAYQVTGNDGDSTHRPPIAGCHYQAAENNITTRPPPLLRTTRRSAGHGARSQPPPLLYRPPPGTNFEACGNDQQQEKLKHHEINSYPDHLQRDNILRRLQQPHLEGAYSTAMVEGHQSTNYDCQPLSTQSIKTGMPVEITTAPQPTLLQSSSSPPHYADQFNEHAGVTQVIDNRACHYLRGTDALLPTPQHASVQESTARADTLRADTPRAVIPRVDTPRAVIPRADTPRADTPRAAIPRADTPRAVIPRADTPRAVIPRADTVRAAISRTDNPRAVIPRADNPRAVTPRVDTPRADTPRADTPRAETPREDSQQQQQPQPSPSVSPSSIKGSKARPHLSCKLSLYPPASAAVTFLYLESKVDGWVSGVIRAGGVVGGGESGSWEVATGVWERQVHLEEVTRMKGYFFSSENYSIKRYISIRP